ncbi:MULTISPECIES: hypothetical protein [Vibrio harveyi group]|uniref:hypothetical protein n=1 Tax=Vibrio harveyi group TaxID=717610 RepID=UPI00111F89F2|nr:MULTISPECIES: hypothetical protein [Vibrio harveyi group]MCR9965456.1 hypothetical protein [Vibrio antiquarius]TOK63673.1 hypothetical protein CGI17_07785 [Vibrio parahaemolyticus]TOK79145.1 hypothetical protein CGI11_17715 [Vibrio parahaemolyticus]TOK85887.1 hypothetical protein CGI10_17050 [Vibrio parahaemolyticus]
MAKKITNKNQTNQMSIGDIDGVQLKKGRGGARKGAGRPKTKPDTKVMRVPVDLAEEVQRLIDDYKARLENEQQK